MRLGPRLRVCWAGWGKLQLRLRPHRVGVAYVSVRVTPKSTARSVVLEVLPLLGRQVCTLGLLPILARLGWGSLSQGGQVTIPAQVWLSPWVS